MSAPKETLSDLADELRRLRDTVAGLKRQREEYRRGELRVARDDADLDRFFTLSIDNAVHRGI